MSAQTATPPAEAVVADKPTDQQSPQKATTELAKEVLSKAFGLAPAAQKSPEKKADEKPKEDPAPAPEPKEKAKDPAPANENEGKEEKPAEKPKKTKAPDRIIPASELLGEQDNSDAITKAATAAATAAVKAMAPQKEQDPKEAAPEIPRDLQKKLELFKELESDDRFKGITRQVVEFKRKGGLEDQYAKQWRKENPGKEYDPEDEEHTDFYQENDPTARHDDMEEVLEQAKEALIERRVTEKIKKQIEPKLEEQEQARRRQEIEPRIEQESNESIRSAAAAISEDLSKTLVEKGGAGVLEEDPIAAQVIDDVLPKYLPVQEEAVRIFSNLSTITPGKLSRTQEQVIDTINELQDVILNDQQHQVRQVRTPRGLVSQRFVPMAEYHKLSKDAQARAWTIGGEDVVAFIRAKQNHEVKTRYTSLLKAAERRFGGKSGQAQAREEAPKKEQTASAAASAPLSPSVGGSAPAPAPTGGAAKQGVTGKDILWQDLGLR